MTVITHVKFGMETGYHSKTLCEHYFKYRRRCEGTKFRCYTSQYSGSSGNRHKSIRKPAIYISLIYIFG
jgi:hypothetical protein